MSNLPVAKHIEKFLGSRCKIYDNERTLRGTGIFSFSINIADDTCNKPFASLILPQPLSELQVLIKDVESNISDTETDFEIQAVEHPEESVYLLLTVRTQWQHVAIDGAKRLSKTLNITDLTINDIDEAGYRDAGYAIPTYDWANINRSNTGGTGNEKEDAFEDLCCDLLLQWKVKKFDRTGKGADSGKDAEFSLLEDRIPGITFDAKWILQCKYSENYSNLNKDEIYKEMVKVLEHRPDHLLIMTNRKKSAAFDRWIKSPLFETPYYIPFKIHIIGKDILNKELSKHSNKEIRDKYFPRN